MGVRAVHLDLREHRERHVVLRRAERLDLALVAGLLVAELVARETEHLEALRMELAVESLETGVLRREAALRRDVHDQQRLAAVVGK